MTMATTTQRSPGNDQFSSQAAPTEVVDGRALGSDGSSGRRRGHRRSVRSFSGEEGGGGVRARNKLAATERNFPATRLQDYCFFFPFLKVQLKRLNNMLA